MMYQVTVMSADGRKIIARSKFQNEDDAWAYYDRHCDKYTCEFKNLSFYKVR